MKHPPNIKGRAFLGGIPKTKEAKAPPHGPVIGEGIETKTNNDNS